MLGNNIKQDAGVDVALAGAVSGFMTRFICQPLDVIKIRFQVNIIWLHYNNIIIKHIIYFSFN